MDLSDYANTLATAVKNAVIITLENKMQTSQNVEFYIARVRMCAVFSLSLTCKQDEDPSNFDPVYNEQDQIAHKAFYKGICLSYTYKYIYIGNDKTSSVETSNELIKYLWSSPNPQMLFDNIESNMMKSKYGNSGRFVIGGMELQSLSYEAEGYSLVMRQNQLASTMSDVFYFVLAAMIIVVLVT
ncbi:hypothetical protein RFI_07248, partial [Reticulomyxa filosa]